MEKKYEHQQAEAAAQALWQEHNVYSAENNPGPVYSIDTPPPTVSGSLHIGHIFSYTQTDIIARFTRMSGFSVFYPFGFDDNGLPTEKYVEKKLEIRAHELKRSEFINLCLKETVEVEKQFETLWRRIGLSVDWKASYSTIDERSRYISQFSFIELYKKGFIHRKDEPALYCTMCRTTVAQAELDDLEKSTFFSDVIFTTDGQELIVATTRPELLAAVNALFYHPDDIRYKHLAGKMAKVPYYGTLVPILADVAVNPEKGTGLVMSSTFGDKTDVAWFKQHNLTYKPIIGLDGLLTQETGPLAGLRAHAARERIIEILEQEGLLKNKRQITHTVNVHERCKKEIEYLVLTQWFLSLLPYKQEFIAMGDKVEWYPTFMKSRYVNWVENISWDWCLSRQRFYGIPFPAWHCTDCKAIILADAKDLPLDPQETEYKGACSCGSTAIVPDRDVMDTWNTSSLTPYICANLQGVEKEKLFTETTSATSNMIPMAMRPQAHDIIRTWAFDTIVKVWMHNKTIPWKKIVISGHVLSTEKEKISKSKGNSPLAPESLLTNYPADALRYWTASGSLGYDISFSENQIGIGQKLLIKLWNAFRFAEPYIQETIPGGNTPENLGIVNEWVLDSISSCFANYASYFKDHEFSLALSSIEHFFWQDFCDNYLEIIKDQLMNPNQHPSEAVNATRWTLATVGMRILQLYGPFVPHLTETLYGLLYKKHVGTVSLHQTKFAEYQTTYAYKESAALMTKILAIISQVRKLKTERQLSLKTELAQLTISSADQALLKNIMQQESLIKGVIRAHVIVSNDYVGMTGISEQDGIWRAEINII